MPIVSYMSTDSKRSDKHLIQDAYAARRPANKTSRSASTLRAAKSLTVAFCLFTSRGLLLVALSLLCLFPSGCGGSYPEGVISGGQLSRSFGATGTLLQNNAFACTATLVATDAILTAAHCVTDRFSGQMVSANSLAFGIGVDPGSVDRVPVASVSIAPGWNGDVQSGSDLAVLRLQRSVQSIRPVILLTSDPSVFVGQDMVLIGYGRSFNET